MPTLLLLAVLLAPAPDTEAVEHGVIEKVHGSGFVTVQYDSGKCQDFDMSRMPLGWHLDPRVTLPPWWLRVGARMKIVRRVSYAPGRIASVDYLPTLVCLGPYQRRAEDEERWLRAIQARVDAVPTEGQIARGERLRLDRAPKGCDLALGPEEVAVIEAMGSCSHLLRECVTKALREKGIAALRTLIWARHAEDCEVRTRAEGLLRELGWDG